ncbi:hypothetical protein ACFE04_016517 [Oxalis oulophora]
MDKSWIKGVRTSNDYRKGVQAFIDFAHINAVRSQIKCPCLKCCNLKRLSIDIVHQHILSYGFLSGYTTWTFHGEQHHTSIHPTIPSAKKSPLDEDDINGLLRDALGFNSLDMDIDEHNEEYTDEYDEMIGSGKVEVFVLDAKSLAQAHRYVILNHKKIIPYRKLFLNSKLSSRNKYMDSKTEERLLVEEFPSWLQGQV